MAEGASFADHLKGSEILALYAAVGSIGEVPRDVPPKTDEELAEFFQDNGSEPIIHTGDAASFRIATLRYFSERLGC
jgi:hypothetical protein